MNRGASSLILKTNIAVKAAGRVLSRSHNIVTVKGIALTLDALTRGDSPLIKYCALGAGGTTPADSDVALEDERVRVPITGDQFYTPHPGQRFLSTYFAVPAFYIREVGLFAGDTATGVAGSGILFNRAPVDEDNTTTPKDITVEIILQLLGG